MKTKMKRVFGILFSLALVLGMIAGLSTTALAYDGNPYSDLVGKTTTVKFNDMDWYIIKDESAAVDAGNVTLLAKDPIVAKAFLEGGETQFPSNNTDVNSTHYQYKASSVRT